MKIFYLVQAHAHPELLKRMIDRLTKENVFFLIHIDLKSDIRIFKELCTYKNVQFIEDRINCVWGDFSQVQATLNLIENLKAAAAQPEDRIVLISGQDYPLKTADAISSFYQNHSDTDFIEMFVAEDVHPRPYLNFRGFKINRSTKRGDYVIFKKHNFSGIYKSLLKGCFKFEYLKHFFNQRELDSDTVFYKGSSWWALRYETLLKIITLYHADYKKYHDFYKVSFCVDEYFFQTLLAELMKTDNTIKVKHLVSYIDWDRKDVPLPVTFTMQDTADLQKASEQDFLYARKFDANTDANILNWIDTNLLNKDHV